MTRDEIVAALRPHRAEIIEADEWRPLADHVLQLMAIEKTDSLGACQAIWRADAAGREQAMSDVPDEELTWRARQLRDAWRRIRAIVVKAEGD